MPWAEARRAAPGALLQRLRAPLSAGHVRQAVAMAYVFLLVILLTMASGAALIESVMISHVRELVLGVVQSQSEDGWQSVEEAERVMWRERPEQRAERATLVVDAQGRVRYGQQGLWEALACPPSACHGWHRVQWRDIDARATRMELVGLAVPLADGGVVYEAYDVLPMLERVRVLPLMAGAGLFVVVLLSIAASMRFGARSLARVEDIRQALRRYAEGDTGSRVRLGRSGRDELESLALSVNQALERINVLMDEVKDVSSHIAHELRTPLTRLHNRLCAAQEMAQVPGAARSEMRQAVDEVERIQRLSAAVLRIGAIESGRCAHQFEAVEVRELLGDVMDYFQPLAEMQGLVLSLRAPAGLQIQADRSLLMQALSNLLDNALKYGAGGGVIELFAAAGGAGGVEVGVADRGPGIAPLLRERVQRRFVRLDGPGRRAPGYGLGLSLVQAIARLHGSELRLGDWDGQGAGPGECARGLKAAILFKQAVHGAENGIS